MQRLARDHPTTRTRPILMAAHLSAIQTTLKIATMIRPTAATMTLQTAKRPHLCQRLQDH
ncbi:hypothetical protein GN958_ATG04398 [Phytophthora infestans]|uniref:Uncharacterized protein n=1 Tax=Phytophthora infestans TaxID=4787 RepID=A0A8S9V190_PHYIN|nr:hypothetical protein GN958_ATG04398 [Phytophthora infestans]